MKKMIKTERLVLRQWQESDFAPFAAMCADPRVMEHFPKCLSLSESDTLVRQFQSLIEENGWGLWAVELAKTGEFIGFVGLNQVTFEAPFTPAVEIGWRLAEAHWGKGYATEAARAALKYAFETLNLPEVVAFTAVANARSRAVMERLGMHRDSGGDFDHPRVPEGSPVRRHILYRIKRPEILTLKGEEILPYLNHIALLRMEVFKEWPYLYEGELNAQIDYLKIYFDTKDSILILAQEGETPVGLAIGLPVNQAMEEVHGVFKEKGVDSEKIYYLSDEILLKAFRLRGIGFKMIQAFEGAVRELNRYEAIYFCEVERAEDDPRRPEGYHSLDVFWDRLGYHIVPGWHIEIDWLEVRGEEKKPHRLRFRKKML